MLSMTSMPDESLMDFVHRGHIHAFDGLCQRHAARFYRMAYGWLLDDQAALHVHRQAWLSLWSGKARWKPGRKNHFIVWFYQLLARLATEQLQLQQQHFTPLITAAELPDHDGDSLQATHVQRCLRHLPMRQRFLIQFAVMESSHIPLMADIFRLSTRQVEEELAQAKSTLLGQRLNTAHPASLSDEEAIRAVLSEQPLPDLPPAEVNHLSKQARSQPRKQFKLLLVKRRLRAWMLVPKMRYAIMTTIVVTVMLLGVWNRYVIRS